MSEAGNHHVETAGASAADSSQEAATLEPIREALRGLRFGIVSIIVQDGVVVQIDRTEKRRMR